MICLTLPRRVDGQSKAGRNCATQSKMCAAKESRGYLSARSSTRCIHAANCSIASPLGVTLAMRKSRSSKRRSVSNNSLRKTKDPDHMRLSTRSPGRVGMPAKISAAKAGAGGLCGGRGGCGREEGVEGRKGLPHHLKPYERFCRSPGMMMLRWFCSVCS